MKSYATRQFREHKGYVEGQFVVHGQNVKYLDLPSEINKEGTSEFMLNGERLDPSSLKVLSSQRIICLKEDTSFKEGDTLYFSYQRDPLTMWGETDDPDPAGFYEPPTIEAMIKAEEYTFITKKNGEDYISFIQEVPDVFAFGNTSGQSICELQHLMAHFIDIKEEEGKPYEEPFSYEEVVP